MNSLLFKPIIVQQLIRHQLAGCLSLSSVRNMSGGLGSGSGKGGGSGGSIRDAGGAFGKQEAAREEEFFRRKQKEQLESMKKGLDSEKDRLEKLIKDHEKEIEKLQKLQKDSK
ncbi:ATPase inhibitor mai-1, mitochondrial-like [Oppia nitens]|uniref:ATPase inhibitor mai-1, mitochondrial-like n=1 Tax=Oppia nitens TaxID=1686743 RepID=UPI0023DC1062|nr:ATPase inhibitor mai-1, mitochondrial-like [Oppia nitens]